MVNAVLTFLDILFNLYSDIAKRVRIVDVQLQGPRESGRDGKKYWIFELIFTIRAPKGAKVMGKWIIIPRVKRKDKWIDYAPLISPSIEIVSRMSFAPLYVETDFNSYIYVYGGAEKIGFTSAIADMSEPFELLIEVAVDHKEYKGAVKKVKLQKLIKKYRKMAKR